METEPFNGIWVVDEVPADFIEILTILGYSMIEKKYLKKCKIDVHIEVDENVMTAKIDIPFNKRVKQYFLNNEPVQYQDERNNTILEVAHRPDPNTVKVRSIYLDKGFTVMETRQVIGDTCHHEFSLAGVDHPQIEVKMVYEKRVNKSAEDGNGEVVVKDEEVIVGEVKNGEIEEIKEVKETTEVKETKEVKETSVKKTFRKWFG